MDLLSDKEILVAKKIICNFSERCLILRILNLLTLSILIEGENCEVK